jgi:phage shock protein A
VEGKPFPARVWRTLARRSDGDPGRSPSTTDLAARVAALEKRLDNERRRIGAHDRDLARIGPQVAALEQRVEALRESTAPPPVGNDTDRERARSLLAEVRREHAQVRARASSLVRFEERIRRLEQQLGVFEADDPQPAPKN